MPWPQAPLLTNSTVGLDDILSALMQRSCRQTCCGSDMLAPDLLPVPRIADLIVRKNMHSTTLLTLLRSFQASP